MIDMRISESESVGRLGQGVNQSARDEPVRRVRGSRARAPRLMPAHLPRCGGLVCSRETEMAAVKHIAPTRIGGGDIEFAQGVRAGSWLFFTGHMASDLEHGMAASVA